MLTQLAVCGASFIVGLFIGKTMHFLFTDNNLDDAEETQKSLNCLQTELDALKKEASDIKLDYETSFEEMELQNSVHEMTIKALQRERVDLKSALDKSITVDEMVSLLEEHGATLVKALGAYDRVKNVLNQKLKHFESVIKDNR